MLLALLGSKPQSQTQTEQIHPLSLWHGGTEGSCGENRTEAAWGMMGGNILREGGDRSIPPQPGDESVKFRDSTERDFLSIKS